MKQVNLSQEIHFAIHTNFSVEKKTEWFPLLPEMLKIQENNAEKIPLLAQPIYYYEL